VGRIPDFERLLVTTQQQLKLLEQAKAAEVIALQRALASERTLRSRMLDEWQTIQDALDTAGAEEGIQRLYAAGEGVSLSVGAAECKEIVSGAKEFEGDLKAAASGIGITAKRFGKLIDG